MVSQETARGNFSKFFVGALDRIEPLLEAFTVSEIVASYQAVLDIRIIPPK